MKSAICGLLSTSWLALAASSCGSDQPGAAATSMPTSGGAGGSMPIAGSASSSAGTDAVPGSSSGSNGSAGTTGVAGEVGNSGGAGVGGAGGGQNPQVSVEDTTFDGRGTWLVTAGK